MNKLNTRLERLEKRSAEKPTALYSLTAKTINCRAGISQPEPDVEAQGYIGIVWVDAKDEGNRVDGKNQQKANQA